MKVRLRCRTIRSCKHSSEWKAHATYSRIGDLRQVSDALEFI